LVGAIAMNDQANVGAQTIDQEKAEESRKQEILKQSREALVDAGALATSLWLSYIFVVLYLTIAASGVSHRDLLLQNPVKMPFLGVELPLIAFFWVAPALFVIIHFYALLHFVLLSEKIENFHNALIDAVPDGGERNQIRRRLPNNLFIQFLAGPHDVRTGPLGYSLRLIAWTTLVFAPILLLLFFQAQFLPFHSNPTTQLQRLIIVADLAVIWFLWRPIIDRTQRLVRSSSFARRFSIFATALVIFTSLTLVTFPGDWLDKVPSCRCIPLTLPVKWKDSEDWTSLHDLLFNGPVDLVNWKPNSPWADRLVVPGIDLIDHSKFDKDEKFKDVRRTISLRGRDLKGAVFNGADLRSVDFTGAKLGRASFAGADLRRATFACDKRAINAGRSGGSENVPVDSDDDFGNETCTDLTAAIFNDAKLDNADLSGANLRGAILDRSSIVGASLLSANLTGASLQRADLTGANLSSAKLFAARLRSANLQGASLTGAKLSAANLERAILHGANMQSAVARIVHLKAAQMQGANLSSARVDGIFLTGAHVWRTTPPRMDNAAIPPELTGVELSVQPLTLEQYEVLKQKVTSEVEAKSRKTRTLSYIAALDPRENRSTYPGGWGVSATLGAEGRVEAVAKFAAELIGCHQSEDEEPDFHFLVRGLISDRGLFGPIGGLSEEYGAAFAARVLDREHCKAHQRLTSQEKSDLGDLKIDDTKSGENPKDTSKPGPESKS